MLSGDWSSDVCSSDLTVEGGSVEYLKIKSWYDMDRGQPFSEEDVEQARRVCVIGQTDSSRQVYVSHFP